MPPQTIRMRLILVRRIREMWIHHLKHALAIAALAGAYYFLADVIMPNLPWTDLPPWWMNMWPTRSLGVFSWLEILQLVGSIVSAAPVALAIAWTGQSRRYLVALTVAAPTAISGLVYIAELSSRSRPSLTWAAFAISFLTSLLAVPFVVALARMLPSPRRLSAPRCGGDNSPN